MSDESENYLLAEIVDDISQVDATAWNLLAGNSYPFVRHEYLLALEQTGCVGEQSGWYPQHLLLKRDELLIGAMPMYLKTHSYGEFVFDWSWAEAYERAGLNYYPKLVVGIPYTPSTGPRLLVLNDSNALKQALLKAAIQVAGKLKVSGVHWLFPEASDLAVAAEVGLACRTGHQFHWNNPGYRDFPDFLGELRSKRRKQIRKERREAADAPVTIEVLTGHDAGEEQWQAYHRLYAATYDRKWGYPFLTPAFFQQVGETMPDAMVLVLARHGDEYVAGAHGLLGADTFFGRNWGCSEFYRSLHFEICYYQTIEYCIAQGLRRFDAGAQGEHKLTRGFLPVETGSAHWLEDERFRDAVEDFSRRESLGVRRYIASASEHSPFRNASSE